MSTKGKEAFEIPLTPCESLIEDVKNCTDAMDKALSNGEPKETIQRIMLSMIKEITHGRYGYIDLKGQGSPIGKNHPQSQKAIEIIKNCRAYERVSVSSI